VIVLYAIDARGHARGARPGPGVVRRSGSAYILRMSKTGPMDQKPRLRLSQLSHGAG
jgi:hypothetical protein